MTLTERQINGETHFCYSLKELNELLPQSVEEWMSKDPYSFSQYLKRETGLFWDHGFINSDQLVVSESHA